MRHDWRWICPAMLVLIGGCGARSATVVGLEGGVSYEGRAIEKGTIDFIPVDGTAGPSASARIADGRYALSARWGLLPEGVYLVRIIGYRKTGQKMPSNIDRTAPPIDVEENVIPAIHNAQSTIKVRVADLPDKNKVDFRLSKMSVSVPS